MQLEQAAPPRILAHEIADNVRRLIEGGVYPPGAPLRQEEVAGRLGVSRIPVREAFRLLEADGLVTVHANRGAFVARPSDEEVAELFDVRLMLEQDLLRRACPKLTDSDLEQIEWLDDRIASARTAAEWVQYDEEFHLSTYVAADRPRTLALVTMLRRSLNAYYLRYLGPQTRAAAWRVEHRALVRALRQRDTKKAARTLERHLAATRSVLLSALGKANESRKVK
ncbi:MAG: GntR family transcriptional regulator [Acidobacteria bacterium]|nr:GntR family transcriptional regulator [Acidobacteriota bacterium]